MGSLFVYMKDGGSEVDLFILAADSKLLYAMSLWSFSVIICIIQINAVFTRTFVF